MNKAVFFDRDGVLNVDKGYVFRPEDVEWVEGAFEAVRRVNDAGYLAIIITNQSGIGRGLYSEDDFLAFMKWFQGEFESRGARIDGVFYCPHHPIEAVGSYRIECECRKPKPGLLVQAARVNDLDLSQCYLVGDKPRDWQAAENAGARPIEFCEGNLDRTVGLALNLS